MNAKSHLKEEFSHSSCVSETSSSELTPMQWINNVFEEAHARLDEKTSRINDSFLDLSHIEGKCDGKCVRASSTESLSQSKIDFHPNVSSKKDLSSEFPSKNSPMASFTNKFNASRASVFDMSPAFENYLHKERSFASCNMCLEPHPLEDSFFSCLSSLKETEFEFDSSP